MSTMTHPAIPSSETLGRWETLILEAAADPSALGRVEVQESLVGVLRALEHGHLRVASPQGTAASVGAVPIRADAVHWQVHAWVKHAVLLALRWRQVELLGSRAAATGPLGLETRAQGRVHLPQLAFHDKLDTRTDLDLAGVRVVPPGVVREGAFVAAGAIVMPGFVNIGAYVGAGTMVDTWATVGSCAQVGVNVHLAGGVGIGGVLEPAGARPVIIGDDAFIGSRAIVVEGTVVGERAVLGANVCLTASTPIIDVTTKERVEHRGFVPAGAVVAPGTRPKVFPGGEVQLQCAYIIAYRSERTDAKVSLNAVLRETGLAV